ncbi:hypothetical protein BCR32DRAFT_324243 [Anaeromyces robustus]|uniref:Uncharacterized protein n=1 Tax=Anaeromyces robustus TaxID=1754192 RepID=A0A1Y1XQ83_9FUNG|nr:hypothetical protein BCR32DRAFT_324243 [Anaeromyces robustus]|eukprot:ORX87902.1 hypothetical protein BCR32DRAFT_324243 [Anaeromyces robustus]
MSSYKSTFLSNSLTRQKLNQMSQNSSMKNGHIGKYNIYLNKKNSKNSFKEENSIAKSYEPKSSIKDSSCWLLSLDLINFIQSLCIGKLSSQAKWSILELYTNAKNIKTNFDSKLDKRIIEKYKLAQKRNSKKAVGSPQAMELCSPKSNNNASLSQSLPNSSLSVELSNAISGNNSCVLTRSEEHRAKLQAEFFYSHQNTLSYKFVQAAQHFYKSLVTRNTVKTGDKNNDIWPSSESKITKMKTLDSFSNNANDNDNDIQTFGISIKSKNNHNNNFSLSTSLPANSFINYSISPINNNITQASSTISSDLPFKLDEDIITEEKEDEENDDNYIYSDDDNMEEDQSYGNCMDDQLYNYLQNKNIKTYY